MDPNLTKQQADEIRVLVTDLNKRLDTLDSKKPDVLDQATIDKLVGAAVTKLIPTESKMIFTEDEKYQAQAGEEKVSFGKYLQMVKWNHPSLVKTVMEEQTSAQGGYLIPTGYSLDIIGELNNAAVVMQLMTQWTQQFPSQTIPRWLTDLTVYWVDEDATKTLSKPTFTQITSTVKKIAVIVPMTDELLADNKSNLKGEISRLVRENIAFELERVALVGNTGVGDAFMGWLYAAGVNAVAQAGVNLNYDDLIDTQQFAVLEKYRKNPIWVMNRAALALIMKIRDLQNRPIWNMNIPEAGAPPTILGDPYKISSSVASNILYGDPKNIFLSQLSGRTGITVTASQSAVSPITGSVEQNAYMQDETWFRFVIRRGVLVALPAALVKLTGVA